MTALPKKRLAARLFRAFAILVLGGILVVEALLASAWLERRTDITLPTPTGPFAIGRMIYDWADDAHSEALAPVPATKRELLVWIWYPAAAASGAVVDDYLPGSSASAGAERSGRHPVGLQTFEPGLGTSDAGSVEGPRAQRS
jgi:hypothetical protein